MNINQKKEYICDYLEIEEDDFEEKTNLMGIKIDSLYDICKADRYKNNINFILEGYDYFGASIAAFLDTKIINKIKYMKQNFERIENFNYAAIGIKDDIKDYIFNCYLFPTFFTTNFQEYYFVNEILKKFDKNLYAILSDEETIISLIREITKISYASENIDSISDLDPSLGLDLPGYIYDLSGTELFLIITKASDKEKKQLRDIGLFNPNKYLYDEEYYNLTDSQKDFLQGSVDLIAMTSTDREVEYVCDQILEEYLKKVHFVTEPQTLEEPKILIETKQKTPSLKIDNNIRDYLKSKIKGQDKAIDDIILTLKNSEISLMNQEGPKGVFLLAGPTGVGKTALVKALNDYYHEYNLIRVDMGEYKEGHMTSKLYGSPPGYIGYHNKDNVFTSVKNNPYSIILLDEIEKAHPDILDVFLHVFSEGVAKNSKQEMIDFRDTVIFMTSNIGSVKASDAPIGFESSKNNRALTFNNEIKKTLPPEFRGRIDLISIFEELTIDALKEIIDMAFLEISENFKKEYNIKTKFHLDSSLYAKIIKKANHTELGARTIRKGILKEAIILYNYIIENNNYEDEIENNYYLKDNGEKIIISLETTKKNVKVIEKA